MSDDLLITPGSRKLEIKDTSGNVDAKIETDASGNLLITNAGGDISIGDTSSDVFIGDGTNNVDIVFEQNGEIRGTSGVTLTLGGSGSSVAMATDLSLGGNDLTNVNDITISGNLTVNGTTTTLDSTNTVIEDSIIELNSGLTGANTKDIGFIFERGSTGNNAGFVWDESADRFTVFTTTDTASSDTVNTSSVANFQAGSYYGNGANLTSLNASNLGSGTVPSARLSLSASDIPNLAASKITSGTLASARLPDLTVSDFAGSAIQTGSESFSDSDSVLMTAAAVNDRITSFGYTTNSGDITGITTNASGGLSGGTTSGTATLSVISLPAEDDRDMKPNTSDIQGSIKAIKPFFSSYGGMTGSANTTYVDVLVLDTYSDSSGGGPNAITLKKGNSAGNPEMHIWHGAWGGTTWSTGQRVFADNYHPNADKWTTARTLSLTGAVTGSVSWDGSGNASISTTATSDPTLTLSGDASGSATFTNLGNATLSVTVADDSHNHVISNVDGLQTALDAKLTSSSGLNASNLTSGTVPDARIAASSITQHTDSKYLRSDAGDTGTGQITLSNGLIAGTNGVRIRRQDTNGTIWFNGSSATDTNHALWNAYYGNSPTTRGSSNSGFDGIYWNTYRGLHIRGGLGGAVDCIKIQNSSGSNTDHTVTLYASNSAKLATSTSGISVTGNIGVSGTVDGRDIASDGSKLDGISSGADVTPSWVPSSDPSYLTGNQTITLSGDVSGSGTTSINVTISNDSHTHAFNNLTGKTSGTGEYSTSSYLTAGRGSGGVSLTHNDGYGNANVTFNHKSGVPEQAGNCGRIVVNTDSTTGAKMTFELLSNSGTSAINTPSAMELTETGAYFTQYLYHLADTDTYIRYTDNRIRIVAGGTVKFDSSNTYATETYVGTQISNLVDSAPSTLDTLNELAAALGDDANFSTTVTNSIATKLPLAGGTLTGNLNISKANPVLILSDTTASSNADQVAYISFQDNGSEEAWVGWGSSGNTDFTITNSIGSVVLNGNGTTRIDDNLDLNGNADISGNITTNAITAGSSITMNGAGDFVMDRTDNGFSFVVSSAQEAAGRDVIFQQAGGGEVTGSDMILNFTNISIPNKIYHTGDSNCYMQFNSTDQWRVVTGGAERLQITNSETVINDGSNDYNFRVESNNLSSMLFVDGGTDKVAIGTSDAASMDGRFTVQGSSIGSTDGNTALHATIAGSRHHLDFEEERTANSSDWQNTIFRLGMRVDTTEHQAIEFYSDGSSNEHIDIRTGNRVFNTRFNANGNVGIGTGSPSYKLDVTGDIRSGTGSNSPNIIIDKSTSGVGSLVFNNGGGTKAKIILDPNEHLRVYTGSTNAVSERLTILEGGNVGINDNNPATTLDVGGTIRCNNEIQFVDDTMRIFKSSNTMTFRTNGSNRMTLDGNGKLKIGSSAQDLVLPVDIVTGGGELLYDAVSNGSGTDNSFTIGHIRYSNSGSSAMRFVKQNFTGMGGSIYFYCSPANTTLTTSGTTHNMAVLGPAGDFAVDGDLIAYSTQTGSDIKLKENIRDLEGSLDKTLKLRGVKYDWKEEKRPNDQIGFIAQEVQEVVPEVVDENQTLTKEGETHLTVNYPALVPMLVEAIKEQQTIINRLEERLNNLENKGEE